MPIYMDRHDIPDHITAADIAKMHAADLKVEHKFNCRGLTYWCDEERRTAFCLVEAPNLEAITDMHNHAHGSVPHSIIEVEPSIVESFLGRIEDPVKAQNTALSIINEPAFRVIMVIQLKRLSLKKQLQEAIQKYNVQVAKEVNRFNGRIVKQTLDSFLISFESVTKAVLCAIEIGTLSEDSAHSDLKINMGLSAGIPVTEKDGFFEDTINMAERLCTAVNGQIVVSTEIKDLYESENLNNPIDTSIYTLSATDENFLTTLMDYVAIEWRNTTLNVDSYCKHLGFSKSQLNRKMNLITGKSTNVFIKEFRLNRALELLNNQKQTISEIAFKTGFNTPAYFSKCFIEMFGTLPSEYLKQLS